MGPLVWAVPRRRAPILEAVGRAHPGRLLVLKFNTDEHPQVSTVMGVRGIPTFVLYSGGREVDRRSGLMPRAELERWVLQRGEAAQRV